MRKRGDIFMARPITSKKRAHAFCVALFLVGLAILTFTETWWPGIMLATGLPVALRQYLLGRLYDMGISLLVFVGTFITVQFDIAWRIFLPILLTLGAIFILFREFIVPQTESESEKEEDLGHELEEKKKR